MRSMWPSSHCRCLPPPRGIKAGLPPGAPEAKFVTCEGAQRVELQGCASLSFTQRTEEASGKIAGKKSRMAAAPKIEVFTFPADWGLPTTGPFGNKLIAWLTLAKLPHTVRYSASQPAQTSCTCGEMGS